jgi:hypothetical protein
MQLSEPSFIVNSAGSNMEDVARLKRRREAIPERPRRFEAPTRKDCSCHERKLSGDQHDYLLARRAVQLGERTVVAVPVGRVSSLATEDSHEESQSRLRRLQQWICELLIKNQQLRRTLMEMKELESRENEGRNV